MSDRFESLSGLRPVEDTLRLLDVLGESTGVAELASRLDGQGDVLRDTIGWLLSGEAQAVVDDVVDAVHTAAGSASGEWAATLRGVAAIAETYRCLLYTSPSPRD